QVNVTVVPSPVWPFVGETRTGFVGGLLPVPVVAVPPVPFTLTVTDGRLLGISKVSLAGPLAVGAKWTVSVHVAEGAIVWPEQVLFRKVNGAARGLALAIVPMTRFAPPVLVMVMIASADKPAFTAPNGS